MWTMLRTPSPLGRWDRMGRRHSTTEMLASTYSQVKATYFVQHTRRSAPTMTKCALPTAALPFRLLACNEVPQLDRHLPEVVWPPRVRSRSTDRRFVVIVI